MMLFFATNSPEINMFKICASFSDFVAVATHFIENHGGRRKNCKSKFVLVLENGVRTLFLKMTCSKFVLVLVILLL